MPDIFTRLLVVVATLPAPAQEKGAPIPYEPEIRELLSDDEGIDRIELARLGGFSPAAFPLYARILDDPREHPYIVQKTLAVLADSEVKADRDQFVDRAIAKLVHSRPGVRYNAVQLLAQIGSARDTAPIVALLSDTDWTISIAAAKALVAIGDRRALAAMDVWLNSSSPRSDRNERFDQTHREEIAKYRDELRQRLEKEQKPGK